MGSYADDLEREFLDIALSHDWDDGVRSAGSHGVADVRLSKVERADDRGPYWFRIHLAEVKTANGPKLSLTSNNRQTWQDAKALKPYAEKGYDAYIWFRPKGVTDLRGLDSHEKFFGFDVQSIKLDDSPLHYEDGEPMQEVLL